ncbi:hypothetical protein PCE1_002152 [Barthelona sp. PCE]
MYDTSESMCYFFFKEGKCIVLKSARNNDFAIISVHPAEGEGFYVVGQKDCEKNAFVIIHWINSESKPNITNLPQCGVCNSEFIYELPLNVDCRDGKSLVYLGSKMILELPPNSEVMSSYHSLTGDSACIVCCDSIHFLQFNISVDDVDIKKHFFYECNERCSVYLSSHPLATVADHQLFISHTYVEEAVMQYLHCLDWSTGNFLEPIFIWKRFFIDKREVGNRFHEFLGDSHMRVKDGIVRACVEDGAIKTRFFTNDILPYYKGVNINLDRNIPNNIVQDITYQEDTKTIVLKTFNVEEDPESMNPEIETFHLPSFLAEASFIEYHMPEYHAQMMNN